MVCTRVSCCDLGHAEQRTRNNRSDDLTFRFDLILKQWRAVPVVFRRCLGKDM